MRKLLLKLVIIIGREQPTSKARTNSLRKIHPMSHNKTLWPIGYCIPLVSLLRIPDFEVFAQPGEILCPVFTPNNPPC